MTQPTTLRRKPRYILGTFWLILGILVLIGSVANGQALGLILAVAILGYSVYLYRGGRFGFFIW